MRSSITPIALLAMMFASAGASRPGGSRAPETSPQTVALASPAAESGNRFGLDLYRRQANAGGNLFFSPASVAMALAMLHDGAAGETEGQIRRVLHVEGDGARIDASFSALRERLAGTGAGLELNMANALWGQSQAFRPEFLRRLERHFGAGLKPVDFQHPTEAAAEINRWVSHETRGRIPVLMDPGSIDRLTRLVLTNAIYFKGNWQSPFDSARTRDEDFLLAGGGATRAPLMTRTGEYRYFGDSKLQALELPYAGPGFRMLVVLPRRRDGLPALERSLTLDAVNGWTARLKDHLVEVHLPRFRLTTASSLGNDLKAMGMPDAFDPRRADFSPMNGDRDLFVGVVLHKAFVEVNEKGTEAAAATGIAMSVTSAPMEPPKLEVFRADHPFLFLIRDQQTGAILFLGRLANPKG